MWYTTILNMGISFLEKKIAMTEVKVLSNVKLCILTNSFLNSVFLINFARFYTSSVRLFKYMYQQYQKQTF